MSFGQSCRLKSDREPLGIVRSELGLPVDGRFCSVICGPACGFCGFCDGTPDAVVLLSIFDGDHEKSVRDFQTSIEMSPRQMINSGTSCYFDSKKKPQNILAQTEIPPQVSRRFGRIVGHRLGHKRGRRGRALVRLGTHSRPQRDGASEGHQRRKCVRRLCLLTRVRANAKRPKRGRPARLISAAGPVKSAPDQSLTCCVTHHVTQLDDLSSLSAAESQESVFFF